MSGAGIAVLVRAIAPAIKAARDELNRLDGVAGDGDLGLTASTAADALLEIAPALEDLSEAEAIRRCGMEIARRAPSTAGTLIAFGLLAAAKAPVDPAASALQRAAAYLEAVVTTIGQRGNVERGDRTMLDALGPAAEAVRIAVDTGADSRPAVAAAARAADDGARMTATMAAKVGRAGWLADRAAGNEDPGARLVATLFGAIAAPGALD